MLFHPIAEVLQRTHELFEGLAAVTTVSISHSLESRTNRDGSHLEASALGSRSSLIHILYALLRGHGTHGIQVNLQVLHRFQRHTNLEIFRFARSSRSSDRIVEQQPVVLSCLLDVTIANETEGEIQTRRHDALFGLSESITNRRQEAWQRELVVVAITEAHISCHHCHTGNSLHGLVPSLLLQRSLRKHIHLQLRSRIHLRGNADCVIIQHLIFQVEGLSILSLSRDNQTLRILAVLYVHIFFLQIILFGIILLGLILFRLFRLFSILCFSLISRSLSLFPGSLILLFFQVFSIS